MISVLGGRQPLGTFAKALLFALLVSLSAGCTTTRTGDQDRAAGLARLTTDPNRVNLTAAISGATLAVVNGCLVGHFEDGRTMPIIWPETTELSRDGRGVTIADEHFAVGDKLRIGGSTSDTIPTTQIERLGAFTCAGPYVIAATVRDGRAE